MRLSEVISGLSSARIVGDATVDIRGIQLDSRRITKNDAFVALKGQNFDGRRFVRSAVQAGAAAVFSEAPLDDPDCPSVVLPKLRSQLGFLASRIYGNPGDEMKLVGITGTNGKTTTAYIIQEVFNRGGRPAGYIGTLGALWNRNWKDLDRTTPEAPVLHSLLRQMADDGIRDVVLECSSHALSFDRLSCMPLDVAVFTNLTSDHLDFHQTTEAYKSAKWKLFSEVLGESRKTDKVAIFNIDDPVGKEWSSRNLPFEKTTVTTKKGSGQATGISVESAHFSLQGIRADLRLGKDHFVLESSLVGEHNLYNLLTAIAACTAAGMDIQNILDVLKDEILIPGRLEKISLPNGAFAFVDYAHTEDALKNVLRALNPYKKNRLIVVFGCGGDRDRGKRPKMAAAVTSVADIAVLTSDNPRTEDPNAILRQMVEGVSKTSKEANTRTLETARVPAFTVIHDRRQAIIQALNISKAGDIILIAGKGHETYQEIHNVKHPFDDRQVVRDWVEGAKS